MTNLRRTGEDSVEFYDEHRIRNSDSSEYYDESYYAGLRSSAMMFEFRSSMTSNLESLNFRRSTN